MKTAKPGSVDAYIAEFPKDTQQLLKQIRATIKKEAPGAEEIISYGMPGYKLNGALVYFAGYKNHIGFYALPDGHAKFKKYFFCIPVAGNKKNLRLSAEVPV